MSKRYPHGNLESVMTPKNLKKLPETPGVYIYKDTKGNVLYVGKAANLKRRVSSYFQKAHDTRIENLVSKISKIETRKTDSALEALILEAELIKKLNPPYNIREKDDKSFLYVEITNEKFPRVLLARGKEIKPSFQNSKPVVSLPNPFKIYGEPRRTIQNSSYGPFISGSSIREALRILRKIFPWNLHPEDKIGKSKRPCFDYEIGLCPGTCVDKIKRTEYQKTIRQIKLFFEGKKFKIIRELEKEMKIASKTLDFENAAKIKKQIFTLKHIQDSALISVPDIQNSKFSIQNSAKRLEAYDISNISGTSAVGSMVVFIGGKSDKNQYRKFKIYSIATQNDIAMIKEVISRRLNHPEWPMPDAILIDGGKGQVNAVEQTLAENGLKIPTMGIAKGKTRKKNEIIGQKTDWLEEKTMIQARNEAHRFAISFHKHFRNKKSLGLRYN